MKTKEEQRCCGYANTLTARLSALATPPPSHPSEGGEEDSGPHKEEENGCFRPVGSGQIPALLI